MIILKSSENNRTGDIGFVTPTQGLERELDYIFSTHQASAAKIPDQRKFLP